MDDVRRMVRAEIEDPNEAEAVDPDSMGFNGIEGVSDDYNPDPDQ